MSAALFAATVAAGFTYCITPGPAVLALFGIAANQGRRAGTAFLAGHMAGDVVWCGLALVAILGARTMGSGIFDILGLGCGLYLFWLGFKAVRAKRRPDGAMDVIVARPLLRGLVFGVSNPKGYPVAVATFTAILSGFEGALAWGNLPLLLAASGIGFVAGYGVLVWITGARHVVRLYRRYEMVIVRCSGLLFIGFAVNALVHSLGNLAAKRG